MAKVLQCPQCGYQHPIDRVPDAPTFSCERCGRALKVPAALRGAPAPAAPSAPAARSSAPRPSAAPSRTTPRPAAPPTRAPGAAAGAVGPPPARGAAARPEESRRRATGATGTKLPWWAQAVIWILALGIGFLVTYYGAIALGFLTRKQIRAVALHTDFDRYWPLLRLVPVWALISALLVQGTVVVIARRRLAGASSSGAVRAARAARFADVVVDDVVVDDEPAWSGPDDGVPPGAARPAPSAPSAPGSTGTYRPVRVGSPDAPTDLPPPSRERRGGRTEPDAR